jgi:AraC-like DNA-binding protein
MTHRIITFCLPADPGKVGFAIRDQGRITRTQRAHRHEFFQMRVDLAGRADHHIGETRRLLGPGSVSFVLPYRIHRGGRRPDSEFYVINFHHHFLRPALTVDPMFLEGLPLDRAPELTPFAFQDFVDFHVDGADLEIIRNACRQMMELNTARRFFWLDLIRANLLLVIGTVCQRYEAKLSDLIAGGARCGSRGDTLARVTRHIREHFDGRVRLADVAKAAGVTPNYVTQLLKKEIGKSFLDFLTERRFYRARELLSGTDMRISAIAEAVGFNDDAYFARRFKQFTQFTPSEYRNVAGGNPLHH